VLAALRVRYERQSSILAANTNDKAPRLSIIVLPSASPSACAPSSRSLYRQLQQCTRQHDRCEVVIIAKQSSALCPRISLSEILPVKVLQIEAEEDVATAMRVGVKAATGQILFFVPADTLLPADYDIDIFNACNDNAVFAGSFKHAGYPSSLMARIAHEHCAIDSLEDRVVGTPPDGPSALKRELLARLSALREMTW
jgi:hypothetical protein